MGIVRRREEAVLRKRDFILCRYLLVLSAATVGIVDSYGYSMTAIVIIVSLELLSNVFAQVMDPMEFYGRLTQSIFIIIDTTAVFGILLVSGVNQSVSIPFFLMIIICALLERALLIAPVASVVVLGSIFFATTPVFDPASALARAVLLMATGLFYWFAVVPEREEAGKPKLPRGDEVPETSLDLEL